MTNRKDVDEAVHLAIGLATGKPCYLIRVPELPEVPYTVLYPQESPPPSGSFADPSEDQDFVYQISCVGESHRQATWMSDRVFDAIVGRAEGSGYEVAILGVQDRSYDTRGSIVPSGEELFAVADTFRVRAGR